MYKIFSSRRENKYMQKPYVMTLMDGTYRVHRIPQHFKGERHKKIKDSTGGHKPERISSNIGGGKPCSWRKCMRSPEVGANP